MDNVAFAFFVFAVVPGLSWNGLDFSTVGTFRHISKFSEKLRF